MEKKSVLRKNEVLSLLDFMENYNVSEEVAKNTRGLEYSIKKKSVLQRITKKQKLSLLKVHFNTKAGIEKVLIDDNQIMYILLSTGDCKMVCRDGGYPSIYVKITEVAKRSVEFSFDEILKSFGKFDFLLKNHIYYLDFGTTLSLEQSMYRDRLLELRARRLENENFSSFDGFKTIERLTLKHNRKIRIKDKRRQYEKYIEAYGKKVFVGNEDSERAGSSVIRYIIEKYCLSNNECPDKIRTDILYERTRGTIHEGIVLDTIIGAIRKDYPVFIL